MCKLIEFHKLTMLQAQLIFRIFFDFNILIIPLLLLMTQIGHLATCKMIEFNLLPLPQAQLKFLTTVSR